MNNNILKAMKEIFESYKILFAKSLGFFLFAFIAIGASCAIAYPIWLFASKMKNAFSVTMLVFLLSCGIYTVIRRIRANRKQKSIIFMDKKKNKKRLFLFSFGIPGFLIGCYALLFFFLRAMFGYGLIVTAVLVILFGFFLYEIRKTS